MLDILPHFGLGPGRLVPEIALPGSPERCVARFAVEDAHGEIWMLERLAASQRPRREALGRLLAGLAQLDGLNGLGGLLPAYLPVCPPAADAPASYVLEWTAHGTPTFLQVSPYVRSLPLPRPEYLDDAWRGQAVAGLLLALRRAGEQLPALPPAPVPGLSEFMATLVERVRRRAPGVAIRLAPALELLAALPEALAGLPQALAHGDLHPLNILWGEPAAPLRAVIDWEFCGAQPLLYDAANCLGCAGFEHPSGLTRDFALALVAGLAQDRDYVAHMGRLPLLVLASRLGWLSEWLRKGDQELLDMELDYCGLLASWQERLGRAWGF